MKAFRQYGSLYLYISPFFIIFAVFSFYPILFSTYLSFQSWDGLGPIKFVGIRNYRDVFSDAVFWKSLVNTLTIWVETTIPGIVIALILAFLLNSSFIRFKNGFRILYFLPNVTSIVAVAIVFATIFSTDFGVLNAILSNLGLPPIDWLNHGVWTKVSIALLVLWRTIGYNALLFLAGLQGIAEELYEAAKIDGATKFQIFTRITVPLLQPVILFVLILTTISGLQIFTEPQVLLGNSGGAGYDGMTVALYLYNQAFIHHYFGYASAIAWVLFVIIAVFSIVNWKIGSRDN